MSLNCLLADAFFQKIPSFQYKELSKTDNKKIITKNIVDWKTDMVLLTNNCILNSF